MIRIQRSLCPSILDSKRKSRDRYRNKEVVTALWNMQRAKCCYCEQLIPAEGHGKAVEHFRPKAVFKSRRNDWLNLLLACPQCNGIKSAIFPIMLTDQVNEVKVVYLKRETRGDPAILDPSNPQSDPEEHLDYHLDLEDGSLAGQIFALSPLGKVTIEVTGIDQSFIHRKRHQHWRDLIQAFLRLDEAADPEALESARLHFQNRMSSAHEFAGLARALARSLRLDDKYGVVIPALRGGA